MRNIAINLRAYAHQRDIIDLASAQLGRNRSDFMLEAACEKAHNVLLDQTFFGLDAVLFAQFSALCDAPASPNLALARLLASASPWDSPSPRLNKKRSNVIKSIQTAPTKQANLHEQGLRA